MTVLTNLAEGFGHTIGEAAGDKVPEAIDGVFRSLPTAYGQRVGNAVYGFASNIEDKTNLRAAVAANFRTSADMADDELRSVAIHLNSEGYIEAPGVVTLGLALMAERERPTLAQSNPGADIATIQATLRDRFSINVFELIAGSDLLNKYSVHRAITTHGENVEIEWDPTDSATEQCRLTVRRGLVVKGRAPRWDSSYDINIPSYEVWGQ